MSADVCPWPERHDGAGSLGAGGARRVLRSGWDACRPMPCGTRVSVELDHGAMNRSSKRFSAGAVVVRRTPAGWHYLLLRVYRTWDFPKGGVEDGETPLQAAVREVEEETSLTDLSFDWGEPYCETPPYSAGKVARYYLAASRGQPVALPINAALGRPEHHEFRWVQYGDAQRLLPERLQPVLRWAAALLAD
jgi:8-oxo-dGTP pyrophosphatase MutT (NUDIX family)